MELDPPPDGRHDPSFVPSTDELVANNARYAQTFVHGGLPVEPSRHVAIVACMDSRIPVFQILGMGFGEAHVIRNAGGVITDDVVRSLCVSQRYLGTREIILLHHSDCGLQLVSEDQFKQELENELGIKPWWSVESFSDPYTDTKQSLMRLRHSLFVPYKDHIRGFVYDVDTGLLNEVT